MEFGQILSLVLIALFYVIPLILKAQKKKEEALKQKKRVVEKPPSHPYRERKGDPRGHRQVPVRSPSPSSHERQSLRKKEMDHPSTYSADDYSNQTVSQEANGRLVNPPSSLKKTPTKPPRELLGKKGEGTRGVYGKKKAPTRSLLGKKRESTRELKGRKKGFERASVNASVDANYAQSVRSSTSRFSRLIKTLPSKKDLIIISEVLKPYDR